MAVCPHMLILHMHCCDILPDSGVLRSGRFVRFWASGTAKFPKMWDSLPRTLMNHCAKFDAASFILSGEILNRTKLHTRNITKKQTVNDISTPGLSACVENKAVSSIQCNNCTRCFFKAVFLVMPLANSFIDNTLLQMFTIRMMLHFHLDGTCSCVCVFGPDFHKWSNFNERPHCRRGGFFTIDNIMWHRPVGSTAVGCSTIIEDPFAAYTAADTPSAFRWIGHPLKLLLSMGTSTPSNAWF